ncbi:HlyD family efflux transporter periplasmic adaptor subunit [Parasphingorhabdus sp.]|uniref:HlyD family efflux transporter periplasmic adaptor subunit n=1 Tax=Parasphingorhabdus sp. TaxID=2709688 RepID=UPI003002C61D
MKILSRIKTGDIGMGGIMILACAVFLALLVAWSNWAELDQVSRAPGTVIPSGRVQLVQSNDGGVITDIKVREGDIVREGELLVILDQIKINASVAEAEGKVASLMSSMARIEAELFDRPLKFPAIVQKFPDFATNQRSLYSKRRQALRDQLSALNGMLGLARQELNMNSPLLEFGDVSRADIIRLQRGVADLESQIVNVRNSYIQELQTEYTRTEEELASAREILTQRSDILKGTKIRAPANGIVKNIRLTTIGGVLRPGDEVLTIVPTGGTLIIEAKVSPSDIAYVRLGQTASVNFDAYDSSIYGSAQGEVTYISPDTLTEQTANGDLIYYRVHVSVDTSNMKPVNLNEKIEIQPGMTASVEIQTGKNTVFRYIFKPVMKTFRESLTER